MSTNIFRERLHVLAPLCLLLLGATLWPELELLVPSLPAMKEFFGVSEGQIQQLLSANFIGFLIGVFFAGPLCDSLGRRVITSVGMVLYLLASALAPLALDFNFMIAIRFVQGLCVSAPIIGGSTLLFELTKGKRQIFWMSMSSASITLCMAIAPLFGAYLNQIWGFYGNLWAIFIAGLIGIVPFLLVVPETLAKDTRKALSTRALADNYWQVVTNARFMGLAFVTSALPAAYWVYTGVSSLYMVDHLQLDPALFGKYQGPIVGTFAVLSLCMNFIHKRLGLHKCLWVGFVLMLFGSISLVIMCAFDQESVLLTTIFMMFFVGGMVPANSLLFPSAINQLPSELQGSGQSMIQALRLLLASLGTLVLGFSYTGPFLPVSLVLFLMFLASSLLLWKLRSLLNNEPSGLPMAGH